MPSWESGEVEANELRLHYTRTGGDLPPLVLAHGVTDSGLCWSPVAEALAPEYDVVMVDARGHGRSEAPEEGYGPAEQAADLRGVIAALGLARPLVLGHSMGAVTALALAGTYPDVPRAILLEDPPAFWLASAEDGAGAEDRRAGMRAWLEGLRGKRREELVAEGRAQNPGWSLAELEPWADAKLAVSPAVTAVFRSRTQASVDWPATLRRVACPVLLITADTERGAVLAPEGVEALRALVPGVRVEHVPGAGHNIRREQPARFLEVVRAFLAGQRAA